MLIKIEKHYTKIIIALAVIFLFVYLIFLANTWLRVGPVFSMPDENVNYFFTELYAEQGVLQFEEPLNDLAKNRIHPRSFNVVQGYLVPGSFLGLILFYGGLAKIFSIKVLPFLTPIFAVLAVIAFYFLSRKIFNKHLAFIAGLLLFILPGFAYYATKSMVPNVLFISFIIISFSGFYSYVVAKKKGRRLLLFLASSILLGICLTIRTVEAAWLFVFLITLAICWRRKIKWYEAIIFVVIIFIVFIPVLYFNQQIYGSYFATGYSSFDEGGALKPVDISQSEVMEGVQASGLLSFIFPFGVNLKNIAVNFYHYIILFNWWIFIPFVIGFLYFIYHYKKKKKEERVYFWLFIYIMIWLSIFYGSWRFFDNPDPTQYSIGTSYVRYFLPIYIMWLPFVAMGFKFVYHWLCQANLRWGRLLFLFFAAFFIWQSIWLIFYGHGESLVPLSKTIVEYKVRKDKLLEVVPAEAVILTKRAEKFLYPERKVIFYTDLDSGQKEVVKSLLAKGIDVYYYAMVGEEDGEMMARKFKETNVVFLPEKDVLNHEMLYKLKINDRQTRARQKTRAGCGFR